VRLVLTVPPHCTTSQSGSTSFIHPSLTSVLSTAGFRGAMQQRAHQSSVHNIDKMKQRLLNLWHAMTTVQLMMHEIEEYREHLQACACRRFTLLATTKIPNK